MDATHHELTRQQAQEQLVSTQVVALGSPHDRYVHAAFTAVAGVSGAFFLAARTIVSGVEGAVLTVAFFSVMLSMAWWVERSALSEPRHCKLASWSGIGGSLTLTAVVVMPWLYLTPATWATVVAGAAAAALPALVAAIVISRPRSDGAAAGDARRLDEVLSRPGSLRLVAALTQVREARLELVRERIKLAELTVSRHAAGLQDVGYFKIRVGYAGERPRTRLSLTSAGRDAYAQHLAALRDVAGGG